MNKEQQNSTFKELLDKLQQESWQLELLISGFAILGLVNTLGPLKNLWNQSIAIESYNKYLYPIVFIACVVLIVNLVIHVILRGLWIGAIGLRYVSAEIDYESLNYRKRFLTYLKKKVGTFDKYIENLENYCSILFAITFLSLFYILSFFLCSLLLVLVGNVFIKSGIFPEFIGFMLLGFFAIGYLILCLIVFIDFITQGYLKKKEWTSFLYFPIYRLFSIITLSFLYRPLVYNILDDRFSKRLTLILTPIYIGAFVLATFQSVRSNYIFSEKYSTSYYSYTNNYMNSVKENEYIRNVAIQSKIIKDSYLHIFIPFKERIEEEIYSQNKNLIPLEDNRGFESNVFSKKKRKYNKKSDSITKNYLNALKNVYLLKIDDNKLNYNFSITEINNQLGFETFVTIENYQKGKHVLNISRFSKSKKTKKLEKFKVVDIPFWYYKD